MQRIGVRHLLVWIKVKPSLTSLLPGTGIPSQSEALKASIWKFHKVLQQREDAECIRNGIINKLAVGPVRANVMLAVFLIETGSQSGFRKSSVTKISKDRRVIRFLHGLRVMRAAPSVG